MTYFQNGLLCKRVEIIHTCQTTVIWSCNTCRGEYSCPDLVRLLPVSLFTCILYVYPCTTFYSCTTKERCQVKHFEHFFGTRVEITHTYNTTVVSSSNRCQGVYSCADIVHLMRVSRYTCTLYVKMSNRFVNVSNSNLTFLKMWVDLSFLLSIEARFLTESILS